MYHGPYQPRLCLYSRQGVQEKKPDEYVAHLLGHEAQGSLLAELKERGWATDLCAGIGDEGFERNNCCSLFGVDITVTNAGLENWYTVIDLMFAYIGVIRCTGPAFAVFDELKKTATLSYRFQEDEDPRENVERLASVMVQDYKDDDILPGTVVLQEFDAATISSLVDLLIPETLRVDLMHPSFHTGVETKEAENTDEDAASIPSDDGVTKVEATFTFTKVDLPFLEVSPHVAIEPYFGCPYSVEPLPESLIQQWRKTMFEDAHESPNRSSRQVSNWVSRKYQKIYIPNLNPFIPDDLEVRNFQDVALSTASLHKEVRTHLLQLCKEGADISETPAALSPELVSSSIIHPILRSNSETLNTKRLQLWYHRDTAFLLPKSFVTVRLVCPILMRDPKYTAFSSLWTELVLDALTETAYMSHLADLELAIRCDHISICVTVFGFHDKLPVLLEEALSALFQTKPDSDRFEAVKEMLLRRWKNRYIRPSSYAEYLRLLMLCRQCVPHDVLLDTLGNISEEDMSRAICNQDSEEYLWSGCFAQMLVYGNETSQSCTQLAQTVDAFLCRLPCNCSKAPLETEITETAVPAPLSYRYCCKDSSSFDIAESNLRSINDSATAFNIQAMPVRVLPPKTLYLIEAEQDFKATCAEHYFQIGPETNENRAMAEMVEHIMSENLFDVLRTKQQLGYHVGCSLRSTYGMLGYTITVQSSKWGPRYLSERIRDFLSYFRKVLSKPDVLLFQKQLNSLIDMNLQPENNMLENFERNWFEISECRFDFEAKENLSYALRSIDLDGLRNFYDDVFSPEKARQIQLRIFSAGIDEIGSSDPYLDEAMQDENIPLPESWSNPAASTISVNPGEIKSDSDSLASYTSIKYKLQSLSPVKNTHKQV
eukprot:gb/GECG01002827.1/.p1 GENE.gb/GECG01002827.1/~~gb/GECG01002827.1/.p1  ORF type:complete len:885 (+),score=93.64 gb/GECG01002827.1/:1-2655(+)